MRSRGLKVLVTVTFNQNQLRAHIEPILALDEVESVVLITDSPPPAFPKLRAVVPPRLLVRLFGRAGAKLVLCVAVGLRERPDWIIGFSLVPHGVTAWLSARTCGARVLYHMIGGPVEWQGGGVRSGNAVMSRIGRSSRTLERMFLAVVKRMDVVAVMGEMAKLEMIEAGVSVDRVVVIPASVDSDRFRPTDGSREHDVITVSSLIPRKRVGDIIEATARLATDIPIRTAIVGHGPMLDELRHESELRDVADQVKFLGHRHEVDDVYQRSAVFALVSDREGLSVALTEAMMCGLPAVVTDVGEVRTLVRDGETGFIIDVGDVDALTDRIRLLLCNSDLRQRMGKLARQRAHELAAVPVVTATYRHVLTRPAR
jgi:glycosyltransferase involved in cell wall biosynthesis